MSGSGGEEFKKWCPTVPLLRFDSWIFLKENPDRKVKNDTTELHTILSTLIYTQLLFVKVQAWTSEQTKWSILRHGNLNNIAFVALNF